MAVRESNETSSSSETCTLTVNCTPEFEAIVWISRSYS